jgi:hypothetical protein
MVPPHLTAISPAMVLVGPTFRLQENSARLEKQKKIFDRKLKEQEEKNQLVGNLDLLRMCIFSCQPWINKH